MPLKFNVLNNETSYILHYQDGNEFIQVNWSEDSPQVKFVKVISNIETGASKMEMITQKGVKKNITGLTPIPLKIEDSQYDLKMTGKTKSIMGLNCEECLIDDHQNNKKVSCFVGPLENEVARLNLVYEKIPGTVLEYSDKHTYTAFEIIDRSDLGYLEEYSEETHITYDEVFKQFGNILGIDPFDFIGKIKSGMKIDQIMNYIKNKSE